MIREMMLILQAVDWPMALFCLGLVALGFRDRKGRK